MRKNLFRQYHIGHIGIYLIVFIMVFLVSAAVRIRMLGSAPQRLLQADWNGTILRDISYGEHGYDLYIPDGLDPDDDQHLILYIHGGSSNSGSKEDGDAWCRFYGSKGFITATVDYTLQNHGTPATIYMMNSEIENAVASIKDEAEKEGYHIKDMAVSGVSAGGTLAMNLAFGGNSAIPVKFVFQLAAPAWLDPEDWALLKRVDHLKSNEEFLLMMTGDAYGDWKAISPAGIVSENPVPVLMGYGLKDHCVPLDQKVILMESLENAGAAFDYIEFPKSNHGMYNDLDKMQEFIEMSLEYCGRFFNR